MIEIKSVKKVVWLLIALVLVWGFTAVGARGASTPTSSGLIAYYSFDDDVVDHSGNGNDGTNNGATFVTGKSGKALSFDGANSYVLAHISGSVPKSLTLEAWVYPKAGGVVFSELGQGTINSGWHDSQMEVLTTGETKVGIWTGGMGGVSLGTYPFNSWHHVVMTYDNNNNIIKGYVDGSLIKSATYTKTYPDDLWYAIGASDYTNLGSGAYFSGLIDEIRIYNRALSQAEIQADMNSSTAPGGPAPVTTTSGLIAYYSFDGDVIDHSGNGNDGTNNGATFVTGKSGNALSFDGANSYVLAHISGSVPKSLTLEAWIYPKAGGVVFSELGQGTINSGWHDSQMEVLTTGETKVGIWTGGSIGGVSLGTYPFNSWHHVVMTYDNNNNIIEGYVDGSLIQSATYTKTYPGDLWYAIGASDYTSLGSGTYFSGLIDEVRIYNRALSQAEIQSDMNSSTAPGGPAPPASTVIPTKAKCTGTTPYLYIEDRTMDTGKTVEIPVMMCNADNLANMDLTLNYDTSILKIQDITKGSLNANAIFDWNEASPGKLKISFASKQGASGSGSISVMTFDVIGKTGATALIGGTVTTASNVDGTTISVNVVPGTFTAGTSTLKGDCDGDGKLDEREVLAALQMSVEKRAVDMCFDYNKDGKVDSSDAREMLKAIVSGG